MATPNTPPRVTTRMEPIPARISLETHRAVRDVADLRGLTIAESYREAVAEWLARNREHATGGREA